MEAKMEPADAELCDRDLVEKARMLEEFKEGPEVFKLVESLTNIWQDQIQVERCLERFTFIIDQYQEQPHLLNPHLDSLLELLMRIIRAPEQRPEVVRLAFTLLYRLTKTRGYKVIVRMMPHEASDLEPILMMLEKEQPTNIESWEMRYMLFLWLSIVVMIPFDMCRLDGHITRGQDGVATKKPVMDRILDIGMVYLNVTDKSRDAAAYMLSKFLTRPDVRNDRFDAFLNTRVMDQIKTINVTTIEGMQSLVGLLMLLSGLFKHGKREDLLSYDGQILQSVSKLHLQDTVNALLGKLHIKLVQRIGLNFLKARVAKWRYQRGNRSLSDNIASTKPIAVTLQMDTENDDNESYEIPDEIEEIIEKLLLGLKDKDTVVRWSAAKGIGRVTGRLPRELADDVIGSIMELFSPVETDAAWHGGCLALAELGRRGLLLPQRLREVVTVIVDALGYDEKHGTSSVGANVRDAACYVCWAFARAYDVHELLPYVNKIAQTLIIVSLFDREVNVRRAAAAAFQENVGRQGQFPHGIDILTKCDYFAVGSRSNCYLVLSVYVASFPEYIIPMIEHLINVKTSHWDTSIRELSAASLHLLTFKAPEYMSKSGLPNLLSMCMKSDFTTHHGALLGTAHVTHTLAKYSEENNRPLTEIIDISTIEILQGLTQKLLDAKFFKGSCGGPMKKAVCCFIEKLSASHMPFHGLPIIETWQRLLNDCCQQVEPDIQGAAALAIPSFCAEYYLAADQSVLSAKRDEVLDKYLKELSSAALETTRCGFALALGALPRFMLVGRLSRVLQALTAAMSVNDKTHQAFVESRRDSIKALTSICNTMGVCDGGSVDDVICAENVHIIYNALVAAMKDYTLDSRGDVGAWVREAAMMGLYELTHLLISMQPQIFSPDMCRQLMCALVQQACEKIDRTRLHAGTLFAKILYHCPEVPHIPHREQLVELFPQSQIVDINWAVPSVTFPLLTQLLSLSEYTYSILLGLTVSAGGQTESLVKSASSGLMSYLQDLCTSDPDKMQRFSDVLIQIFTDNQKVDRVTLPMLRMLDLLLTNGCFNSLQRNTTSLDMNDRLQTFLTLLYNLCKTEVQRCKDIQKLRASIDVFCGLVQYEGEVRNKALVQLMIFLCHTYPIIRKNAANKLYETILMYDGLIDDSVIETVTTLLTETVWDEPIDVVKPIRNQICDLLNIARPMAIKST